MMKLLGFIICLFRGHHGTRVLERACPEKEAAIAARIMAVKIAESAAHAEIKAKEAAIRAEERAMQADEYNKERLADDRKAELVDLFIDENNFGDEEMMRKILIRFLDFISREG